MYKLITLLAIAEKLEISIPFPSKEKELHKCPQCEEMKDDVEERPDHYKQDVGNEDGATMFCCASCEHENAMDI